MHTIFDITLERYLFLARLKLVLQIGLFCPIQIWSQSLSPGVHLGGVNQHYKRVILIITIKGGLNHHYKRVVLIITIQGWS